MTANPLFYSAIFTVFVLAMIALDLSIFHRRAHSINMKEAVGWSIFWIALALIFNIGIYFTLGLEPALNFLAGFLLEKALSVDNLFVFLLIFSYFRVPKIYTHQVLYWGILGALVMRALFIVGGIAIVDRFNWVLYLFGIFLIFAGIKLALEKDKEIHPERNLFLKIFKKIMPVTDQYHGKKLLIKERGKIFATPLFVVLIAIESTDIIFAMDSIPAIFAITLDPFIVYTSNVFAILGLRALYFVLEGSLQLFHHLHYGLAFILVFIGFKMLVKDVLPISIVITLSIICITLIISILTSIQYPKSNKLT